MADKASYLLGKIMSTEVSGLRRHYTLLLLFCVYAISLIDRQIMGVLIEPIKREFGVSDMAMGLLTGLAFSLAYCIMGIPSGRYADRTNRRNFIGWCCGFWSAMTLVCGLVTNYWQLALARSGVAIGEAGGSGAAVSMITDLYPKKLRARMISIYMLGAPIGTLIGLSVGARIAYYHGWRSALIWTAVPGVIFALLVRLTATEPVRGRWDGMVAQPIAKHADSLRVVLRDAWRSRAFAGIVLSGALLSASGYAGSIWSTTFLVRTHGLSLKDAGLMIGLTAGPAAIVGSLLSGWLCDKLAQRDSRWQLGVPIVGAIVACLMAVCFVLYPTGHPWVLGSLVVPRAMVFIAGSSVFGMAWLAPSYAAISLLVPADRRATMIAIYNFGLLAVGAGIGPLGVGALSDALTPMLGVNALRWAMAVGSSGYLLGGIVLILVLKSYARAVAPKGGKAPANAAGHGASLSMSVIADDAVAPSGSN